MARRAREMPGSLALRLLGDGEFETEQATYADLHAGTSALASALIGAGAAGQPVLVAHAPGIDFITGLLACWDAGAIAVPCYPPQGRRHRERFEAVLKDSGALLALADAADRAAFSQRGLKVVTAGDPGEELPAPRPGVCLLQYTSGSTSHPKGVKISHANLLHQVRETRKRLAPLDLKSALSWLPPYHDMGLVLKILLSLESGIPLTLMRPEHFIQSPPRWLRAIHRHRAEFSGGPNFAFELCIRAATPELIAGLDLSCWKGAPCGAERIRPETLDRFAEVFAPCGFRREAFLPGYGLAETTLIASAKRPGTAARISRGRVSCGPPLDGMEIRIDSSGEILVKGPSIAAGYWSEDFQPPGDWLHTGDLGFLEDGELFVEGRIKDLLIIDGANHFPDDLEKAAASASESLAASGCAAFSVERDDVEQAIVVQETPLADEAAYARLCHDIRAEIGEATGLAIARVLLVRQGMLARTTSGKIRRAATREAFLAGNLRVLHDDGLTSPAADSELTPTETAAFHLLCDALREATGKPSPAPADDPAEYGLGSIEVTRIAATLKERTGISLPVGEFYAARSFGELARRIAAKTPGTIPVQIPARPDDEEPVLSHSQERMWFLHQLDPDSAAYHVFGALEMIGPLDIAALDRTYRGILTRHEILRSRHGNRNGRPVVHIDPTVPGLEVETEPATDLEQRLKVFARTPFDLAEESPVRALLLPTGPDRHVLALCAHHIVSDGWSIRLLLKELFDGYRGIASAPSPSYLDYACWHRRWVESGGADHEVAYWKELLAGAEASITLPTDFPRPAKASSDGGAVGARIPAELLAKVVRFAAARRASPFAVFLAAFQLLLRKHGSGPAPVIAVPVANRHHPGSGGIFGTLVNTLPFRLELHDGESFAALVDRVRDATFAMLAAQDAPFERIIEAVQPGRAMDRSPLAQVMFDHQEIPFAVEWPGGLTCQPLIAHRGAAQFDLSLLLFALPEYHEVFFEYRTDLFSKATVESLLERFVLLLDEAVTAPDTIASRISALTEQDHTTLRKWSHGPDCPEFLGCVPLDEIRKIAGSRIAISCGEESLSYAALLEAANSIARHLRSQDIMPGDRVAVLLERGLHLPAALLGIWIAGAAYVPLDPANPPERLGWILEDQQPVKVLVSPALLTALPAGIAVIEFHPGMTGGDFTAPPLSPDEPAYILYTSGSTGKPKGVVVSHGALGNFLLSMQEQPGLTSEDRLAAVTTVSFDISALELFLPLITGAAVDLIPAATTRDGAALRDHLQQFPATVLQATPATWRMLLDAGWQGSPHLKILCGGEALDPSLAAELSTRGSEIWNLYGPTETTVWSTIWKLPKKDPRIRIGRPIANTEIAIVAADGSVVPPGVTGELLIGGAGLADGYWQRESLTAERFITHAGSRFYRTGDLARWLPDGTLDCLGRIDSQVKIRGFRVELGEVEAAMLTHPHVAEAAAAIAGTAEDVLLNGYYRSSGSSLRAEDLQQHLRLLLPDYMVPSRLIEVAAMPLTSSGKIDRRALLATLPVETPSAEKPTPHDAIEGEIAAVWQELLNCGLVGRDDDFFALGGHSLLASRMVARLSERLGTRVALDALFERPTVAAFAARIGEEVDLTQPRAVLLHRGGSVDATPMFWLHTLVDGGMGLFPYRRAAGLLRETTSYGIAEGTEPFHSIRDMAARYTEVIRRIQPQGPYRLTGFCFGGNLAAEVASQLAEAGEKIELLVLLEASPTGAASDPLRWLRPSTWWHFSTHLRTNFSRVTAFDLDTAQKRLRMKHRALAGTLARASLKESSLPDIRSVLDLSLLTEEERERATVHWAALHRHPTRLPDDCRVVVVHAQADGWFPRSPTLGWDRYTPGKVEVRPVSGNHEEFLRAGSADEVAATLSGLLS
jgi:amino acid adenylation domain-containing protein